MKRTFFITILLIFALSLTLAACGGDDEPTPEPEPAATEAPAPEATEPPAAEGEVEKTGFEHLDAAIAGEYAGSVVTLLGVMVDEDGIKMEKSLESFIEATGIDVQYTGTKEFETQINVRVDAGDPPDVADMPQPGLLASFARQGKVVDVNSFINTDKLQENYNQGWLDMATMSGPDGDDIMAGVWHRTAGKSFVWYPKAKFEEAGYEVPTTWDEMLALTQTIADDGDPAWCIGIESGAATGWVATDWMENIMLRTTAPENYDKWVAGELPFSSPEVKNAAETMAEIWLNPDYVYGGAEGIVSIFIGDSPVPMFEDPPGCWFHIQSPWITDFFGEGLESGVDYDFFTLPGIDPANGVPILVAGDSMAMFNDRPEVRALMEFFATGAGVEQWVKAGGAISPHNDSSLDWYTTDIDRGVAEAILAADIVRFDASDLMPGEVGAGSFWKGMTDWISGSADLDTVLAEIDESWPAGISGQTSAPAEETADMVPGGFLEQATNGDFSGTVVIVDGPFADVDEVKFNESMKAFEEATGIDVQYVGNKEFEGTISIRVDAGDAPDIADFPQPGLLANFVRQGKVVDPTEWLPPEWLEQQYNSSWLQMAEMEGQTAGVWHRFNGKSLVWYPKDDWDAAGYEIPTTWDEMITLMDTIVSDGDAPWCVGIESGAATGWPATDWMEEFMLRTTSLENYDAWTTGDLAFSSPEVKNAAEVLGGVWFTDGYVFGGREAIVSTSFGDSPTAMFEDPPRCWMHKQGNFITAFFPEGVEAGVDYSFFYLPPIDDAYGKPFLVAGDIMAMFNDRPEVRALMEYFTTPKSASGWLETGGALAAHRTATPDMYGVALEAGIAALVNEATSFRFDGSDLMPGEVGAGSFWKGMTDWVSGSADLDTVLSEIDDSWPR